MPGLRAPDKHWCSAKLRRCFPTGRLLTDSAEVNRMGRDNILRAQELRDTQVAATQESLQLARRNAATLEAILDELRRGSSRN